jgi:hypothetical protein
MEEEEMNRRMIKKRTGGWEGEGDLEMVVEEEGSEWKW